MRVLITGVAGLLGSNLAYWLLQNVSDIEIIGVDDLSGGYVNNLPKDDRFKFIRHHLGNLNRAEQLTSIILDKVDYVFHFAAYAAEGLSPFMRVFNFDNNCGSTAEVINFCIEHEVKRLVYTSSMAVYGRGVQTNDLNYRFQEDDIPAPIDPYGVSKLACELDIKIAGEQHGLDWCIIRPHNIFGPYQNIWDRYRNVLGIWMWQILHGEPMTIYGDGDQSRAFTYVDNDLKCFWNAATSLKASHEIINLGGTIEYTINEAAELLQKVVGINHPIVHLEARHEVYKAVPSFEKSIDLLGYCDEISLESGLSYMWKWAESQPDHERKKWDEYEINKGMYNYWK